MKTDFNKYMFQHFENAYNIGWKENQNKKQKYSIIDEEFIRDLKKFCNADPLNKELDGKCREVIIDGNEYVKGFGEIRILDLDKNIRYAAPNIIIDDILDGIYTPPDEFIKAVKNAPKPNEIEYREFLYRYNPENYWGEDREQVLKIKVMEKAFNNGLRELKNAIEDGGEINCITNHGSLLNYAIEKQKNKEALYLIENGIDINAFDGIELINAIENNMTDVAIELIERDIFIDSDKIRYNPLFIALVYNNKDVVLKLRNRRKELMKTYNNEYVRNCTILDFAKRYADRYSSNEILNIIMKYYE